MTTKIVEVKSVKPTHYAGYFNIIVKGFLFGNQKDRKIQFLNENKEIISSDNLFFRSITSYLEDNKISKYFFEKLPINRNDTVFFFEKRNYDKMEFLKIANQIKYIQFEETQDIIEESELAKEKITEYRLANKKEKPVKQEIFNDMYGQVINIGDKVLISDARYMGLKEATVIEFTNKNLKVLLPNNETKIQMDGQCFKIPKNKEEFDTLNTTLTLNALKK